MAYKYDLFMISSLLNKKKINLNFEQHIQPKKEIETELLTIRYCTQYNILQTNIHTKYRHMWTPLTKRTLKQRI